MESDIIHIPDAVKESSLMFEVLAKGPDCVDDEIAVGSCVYTGKFAPCQIGFPGDNFLYSLNEADVLGVVTEFGTEPGRIEIASTITKYEEGGKGQ